MSKKAPPPSSDPFAARESEKYEQPIASREHLLNLIESYSVPVPQEQIADSLEYFDEVRIEALRRRLNAMVRDGQLFRNRRGGYLSFDHMDLEKGTVQTHPDGFGFLTPESGGKDIYLPERQMRKLMNGDKAAVKIASYDSRRERKEGTVIAVLERAHQSVVGRFHHESGIEYVIPDDKRLTQDILLNRDFGHSAKGGDIVVVRISEYPTQHTQPIGIIESVLGQDYAPGMEVTIALNTHSIPHQWNAGVLAEVELLTERVAKADKAGRKDLSKLAFVTIDGADARDFDDAVYCKPTDNGYLLYVAIADVAHYVNIDSCVDQEASLRGTSVYFPGEVVPMLPEILSNGLCSLNPDLDRLCLVCRMDISLQGSIKSYEFVEAVIHSQARLIYDDVAAAIFEAGSPASDTLKRVLPDLENLKLVYQALARARQKRHAIEFETREVVFKYNQQRKIESIEPGQRNEAHRLIEECMIAANISAARLLKQHKIPTLYRIHAGPNADKLLNLAEFLSGFGISLTPESPTPQDYARVIDAIRGMPEFAMIQTVILRSLLQASYSPDTKTGHFGLALQDYAHFTSPIRRYPDLLVHRGIKHWIRCARLEGFKYDLAGMTSLGASCSRYERRADDASRDAADWLKCEYLQKRIGQQFNGIVTGVTSFGLFVQLDDLLMDGLVHVTALPRDYYQFDPVRHRLVGEMTNRSYQLGDRLSVEVARVDMEDRKVDFNLISRLGEHKNKRKKAGKTGKAKVSKRKVRATGKYSRRAGNKK
ncbi:MAG: ribonuclease R [Gammaproteobacteria bacterium]|nr:ribonuclease R [Gammaproteobacteria bacterium]